MSGFIDLHQHLTFDIDDGAQTFTEFKKMISASCADGVAHVFATPHVYAGRDRFSLSAYWERFEKMVAYCDENVLPVTLHPGAEILFNDAALRFLQAGEIPTLSGSRFILVEFFTDIKFDALFQAVRSFSNAGYIPVIAHIERYECLVQDASRVHELKELLPVRLQVNCSSIIKARRFGTRRFLRGLLKERIIDYIATDAHDTHIRPTCMTACYQSLEKKCGQHYADCVTGLNQMEIIG